MTFGARFEEQVAAARFPICLGLDPRPEEIPASVAEAADVRSAIARFHELAITAVAGLVPAVKLQLAFYEEHGIPGLEALRDTIASAKRAGLLVIADGKRNDIPSTAEAYARAWLGPDAFDADAVTVNPYLGRDSIEPFVNEALANDKGLFVLAHTSNPSAVDYQEVEVAGEPVYLRTCRLIDDLGEKHFPDGRFSSVGAIVGCTFPEAAVAIREALPRAPIVVVGYGAQAGAVDGCTACFTGRGDGALVNGSRSLTYGWTGDEPEDDIGATIHVRVEHLGAELEEALQLAGKARVVEVDAVSAHPDALG